MQKETTTLSLLINQGLVEREIVLLATMVTPLVQIPLPTTTSVFLPIKPLAKKIELRIPIKRKSKQIANQELFDSASKEEEQFKSFREFKQGFIFKRRTKRKTQRRKTAGTENFTPSRRPHFTLDFNRSET